MSEYKFNRSLELFKEAARYIPGAIPGHMTPAITVPGSFPYFAEKAEGCRYWDVDGNEYIDFMCGYGPIVLGHRHPKVDEAVRAQQAKGSCFNHPTELQVKAAKLLVETVKIADWAIFAKNGSDVTTYALQVAREFTQRDCVIACRGGYHGGHAWCTPGHGGLTPEDKMHIHLVNWNDFDEFKAAVEKYKGQIAAFISSPYHHPTFSDQYMPENDWWNKVRKLCDEEGILIIVDDVRAGWRLNIAGSDQHFGFDADMICFSKAIANGYPLSALVGVEKLKLASTRVFFTGSFWASANELAACIATIEEMKAIDASGKMWKVGTQFQEGLRKLGAQHGLKVSVTGPAPIPYMKFANEGDFRRMQLFSAEASKRGVFLHPHHNWFVSAAHTEADIDQALARCDEAFAVVKKTFGD